MWYVIPVTKSDGARAGSWTASFYMTRPSATRSAFSAGVEGEAEYDEVGRDGWKNCARSSSRSVARPSFDRDDGVVVAVTIDVGGLRRVALCVADDGLAMTGFDLGCGGSGGLDENVFHSDILATLNMDDSASDDAGGDKLSSDARGPFETRLSFFLRSSYNPRAHTQSARSFHRCCAISMLSG
jgi:hypothetical protein